MPHAVKQLLLLYLGFQFTGHCIPGLVLVNIFKGWLRQTRSFQSCIINTWPENAHRCGRAVYKDKSVRYLAWLSADTETGKAERSKESCTISLTLIEVVVIVGPQSPFGCNATPVLTPLPEFYTLLQLCSLFPSSYAKIVVWAFFFPPKYKAHWHANSSEHGLSQFQSIHWCSSITCCVLYWGQQSSPTFPDFQPFEDSALLPQALSTRHISGNVSWPVKKCAENV